MGPRAPVAARGGMAPAPSAPGWAPRPVRLLLLQLRLLLLLLPPAPVVSPAATPRSLSPPYFNLAEVARIWATATCGEREPSGTRPRPELYCKLVGGPTDSGSGHTIQVRPPGAAGGLGAWRASSLRLPGISRFKGEAFPTWAFRKGLPELCAMSPEGSWPPHHPAVTGNLGKALKNQMWASRGESRQQRTVMVEPERRQAFCTLFPLCQALRTPRRLCALLGGVGSYSASSFKSLLF